jgi:MFS family permease
VVLRFDGLAAHLPALLAVDVDEPTVVTRAVGIMHGTLPTVYDWPTGSMLFVVVPFELVRHLDPTWFQRNTYLVARYVFAGVSVVVVILTGGLAWLMASGRSERRADTLLASTAVAVSFLLVENGRLVLPDQLQLALVLAAMIGILIYDRTRARSWLVAVGVLAGLAAGTKYLGGLVMVPAAMSVLLEWRRGWTRAATDVGMLLGGALVGLVASVPAVILHPHDVIAGIQFQFGHQAGGHLGYDLGSNGWWYYLTQGLPGNWGWVMTALSLAGLILVAARGTRGQRLVLVFVVLVFAVLGSSKIQFPHYIVLIVPMMAAFAAIFVTWASGHLQRWGGPLLTLALPVVLVVGLVPTVADDLRVVRSASAPNTELVADRVVGNLPGPVWAEPYTVAVATHNQINHAIIGQTPSVVDCRCYVVVSSFMEDRYRQEPLKYAREIAVYDAVERKGELVATIAPRRALPYDWMELPRYGVGSLPLTGATGRVGPRITIYKMPS